MKRAIAVLATLAALPVVSACAMMGGAETDPVNEQASVSTLGMPGQLEPIHAAAFTQDQAVFWVSSNGCTEKKDLTPVVNRAGDGSTITLRRIEEDDCDKPLDEGVQIMWSFEELGLKPGSPVSVNNPYQLPHS